jgi:hypothetical protein
MRVRQRRRRRRSRRTLVLHEVVLTRALSTRLFAPKSAIRERSFGGLCEAEPDWQAGSGVGVQSSKTQERREAEGGTRGGSAAALPPNSSSDDISRVVVVRTRRLRSRPRRPDLRKKNAFTDTCYRLLMNALWQFVKFSCVYVHTSACGRVLWFVMNARFSLNFT